MKIFEGKRKLKHSYLYTCKNTKSPKMIWQETKVGTGSPCFHNVPPWGFDT